MRCRLVPLAALLATLLTAPPSVAASAIPLGVHDGIYTVPVEVNRSTSLEFLIDTGASVVVIPTSVFEMLVRNGTITDDDIVGTGTAILADKSLYRSVQVRLRELRLGDIVVRDVVAGVSPALIAPLLGQSFLNRFPSITFDNQRHLLILSGSAPAAYQQRYPPFGSR